jgi:anti-sigma B factor antagonist
LINGENKKMEIRVEEIENSEIKIIHVEENITFANVKEFSKITQEIIDGGAKRILLNMDKVSFCNSHGFGAIVSIYTRLAKRDGRFAILNPQEAILEVLEITKMDSIIGVYKGRKEALEAISA